MKPITVTTCLNQTLSLSPLGSVRVFEALDSDPALVKTIDAHSPVSRLIQLKVGAQVICTPTAPWCATQHF